MGRTEPSYSLAPQSVRREARAKKARATLNKVIPALLASHPRAQRSIDSSVLIVDPPVRKAEDGPKSNARTAPHISLVVTDTLSAAHAALHNATTDCFDLENRTARVAILNMASPLSPGGGFVQGASSQEESLCMRTTLHRALRDEFYRLPELAVVYTPDVLVFRDSSDAANDLVKRDRWFVDVVSAAMLRMPETTVDAASGHARFAHEADRDLAVRKMRAVLRVVQARELRTVVLGAWGCGAYGNPVGEIASAWRRVLLGGGRKRRQEETWDGIEQVVFAVKDAGMADAFAQAFGDGLVRIEPIVNDATPSDDGNDAEDDVEVRRVRELREKIDELVVRARQTVNNQVRSGLETILADLHRQLPSS